MTTGGTGRDELPEWERSRRRLQAIGFGLVAVGMLVLLYLVLTYRPA